MYSPIAMSVVLKRRTQTTLKLLGNVFIHIAARSRLSLKMVQPCKERERERERERKKKDIKLNYNTKIKLQHKTSQKHQNKEIHENTD